MISLFGSINTLIVEDNDADFYQLRQALSITPPGTAIKYEMQRVSSLSEAEELRYSQFELILLDLSLPDSYGMETYNSVVGYFPAVSIVVITGSEDFRLALDVKSAGGEFLYKEWIPNNFLLHYTLISLVEIKRQEERIEAFMKERLGEFKKLIPRCKNCKSRIGTVRWRSEANSEWLTPEEYIEALEIDFTDGICKDCFIVLYGDILP